jgi:hypothetical protein
VNPLVPITAIGAVLVGSVGVVAAVVHDPAPTYPDHWDARVADLVTFVEDHRGHDFRHPVEVEFLSPDEYSERTRTDESEVSDDDKAATEASEGLLRALGLVTGDVDLFESANDLNDNGTLAFYDPEREVVTVRGRDVTPGIAVTLAHELTHALQDQVFDLDTIELDDTEGAETAFRALVEGDAMRIEDEYRSTLSDDDLAEVDDEDAAGQDAVDDEGVPEALEAIFSLPYSLGQGFVQFLDDDGGNDSIDDAFADPPSTEEHLLDPYSYEDGDEPVDVGEVPDPDDADVLLDGGDFGAASLYLVLAGRIDLRESIHAAFGWGGDNYLHYLNGIGQSCVDLRVTGDTDDDTDELATALTDWAAAGPADTASAERHGDTVTLHACDPGADADVDAPHSAFDALGVAVSRTQIVLGVQEEGAGEDFAECYADGIIDEFTTDELLSDGEPANFQDRLDAVASTCPV